LSKVQNPAVGWESMANQCKEYSVRHPGATIQVLDTLANTSSMACLNTVYG